jgi:hypothetical protein
MGWQMSVPLQGKGVAGCTPSAARVSAYSLWAGLHLMEVLPRCSFCFDVLRYLASYVLRFAK